MEGFLPRGNGSAMAVSGVGEATRRSQRSHGLQIFSEDLLWELHGEMMEQAGPAQKLARPAHNGEEDGGPASGAPSPKRIRAAFLTEAAGPSGAANEGARWEDSDEDSDHGGDDPNAETAAACGLPPDEFAEEEEGLIPHWCSESAYARARNAVLVLWRRDVSQRLSQREALRAVAEADQPLALAAWRFLNEMGYINFGVAPAIVNHPASLQRRDSGPSVVVIGAGCAGLAAARQLLARGCRVVVVEGRSRPGGRVHTVRLEGSHTMMQQRPEGPRATNQRSHAAVADLGGSIVTGIDGNPLAIVAKQLRLPLVDIRNACPLFMPDGTPADPHLDSLVEHHHNFLLDECDAMREGQPLTSQSLSLGEALDALWEQHEGALRLPPAARLADVRRLFDWHMANLEFANATDLHRLSLVHWDQDDPNELPGAHCFVPGCNGRWLQHLCEGVPIMYDCPVSEVRYCASGTTVHTPQRVFQADAVVVTVPLGVLKKGGIAFNPPLPRRKAAAIRHLGFGHLEKVVLLFPHVFWGEDEDMFGHVAKDAKHRGESFLFYSYANISGGALLTALCAGAAAAAHRERPAGDAAARVMGVLRGIFERKGVAVPPPLSVACTRWGSDPMSYGAYSSMPVGTAGGDDYDALAESVGGRVFFAGEATTRKYPATMHGAFYSGLWTAANVVTTLRKAAQQREAAATNGAAAAPTAQAAPEPRAARGGRATAAAAPTMDLSPLAEEKLLLLDRLQALFDDPDHPPDLEMGCVKAVHGLQHTSHVGQSLLRVDIGQVKGGAVRYKRPLVVYCLASVDIACALLDLPTNEARVALLSVLPGSLLLGRGALPAAATELMDGVLLARRRLRQQQQQQQH